MDLAGDVCKARPIDGRARLAIAASRTTSVVAASTAAIA
jgi:hypothetical protein